MVSVGGRVGTEPGTGRDGGEVLNTAGGFERRGRGRGRGIGSEFLKARSKATDGGRRSRLDAVGGLLGGHGCRSGAGMSTGDRGAS